MWKKYKRWIISTFWTIAGVILIFGALFYSLESNSSPLKPIYLYITLISGIALFVAVPVYLMAKVIKDWNTPANKTDIKDFLYPWHVLDMALFTGFIISFFLNLSKFHDLAALMQNYAPFVIGFSVIVRMLRYHNFFNSAKWYYILNSLASLMLIIIIWIS